MTSFQHTVRFSPEDLDLFRDASGDRNPIHCSSDYASRTVYGERLVYGVLGAIACLGQFDLKPNIRIANLAADFHRPMFCGVDYAVRCTDDSRSCIRLMDGVLPVVTATIFTASSPRKHFASTGLCQSNSYWEFSEPVSRREDEIYRGLAASGRYHCDPTSAIRLRNRWAPSAPVSSIQALLWGSYFTGMVLPGQSALFFRLLLDFSGYQSEHDVCEVLNYDALVAKIDPRLGQMQCQATLKDRANQVIKAECRSFIRPSLDASTDLANEPAPRISNDLTGKVALVIGGSRGLGAAITHCLISHGCTVISTSRGNSFRNGVITFSGSATDAAWLRTVHDAIQKQHGKLDFLICNAFPALNALRIDSNAIERIQAYLQQATALVLNPLCLFMGMLDKSGGRVVIVSSAVAQSPVKEWPHYVAAKKAVEGLAEVAALQYPRVPTLIVRPNKLLTEMTNTPMGRRNAEPPSRVASKLVDHLREPIRLGVTLLEFKEPS